MNKGSGVLLISIVALMALSKKKATPIPPPAETSSAGITIDIVGATHNSPASVIEDQSYLVRIGITNQTKKGNTPWGADLDISVQGSTPSFNLIVPFRSLQHFAAQETKVINQVLNVPIGSSGESGQITVGVFDPMQNLLASATEPLTIKVAEIKYAVAITSGVAEGTVPLGFTATSDDLNTIINQGITPESQEYQTACALAEAQAMSQATENDIVAWSSSQGYHTVEIGSTEYYNVRYDEPYY